MSYLVAVIASLTRVGFYSLTTHLALTCMKFEQGKNKVLPISTLLAEGSFDPHSFLIPEIVVIMSLESRKLSLIGGLANRTGRIRMEI